MKRKNIAILAFVAVLSGPMFIPTVQAAAESALSVFRVSYAKTITISVTDIQSIADYAKKTEAAMKNEKIEETKSKGLENHQKAVDIKSILNPLKDPKNFTAFSITLPHINTDTPKLYSIDSYSKTFTLNTANINAELTKIKAKPISNSFNNTKITISTPPVAIAEYPDFTLIETQGVYVNAPDNVIDSLWKHFATLPMIPTDLSSQLLAIDPTSREVYLPVIKGFGHETNLGTTNGYIYSAKDLAQVAAMVPDLATANEVAELENDNGSALIWTRNGILYILAGIKSDSELSYIARNID